MPTFSLTVDQENDNIRLDVYLAGNLTDVPSRTFVKKLIDSGHVTINGKPTDKANHKVSEGDSVVVDIPEDFLSMDNIKPENIPLDVVYEDDFLVVVNKPIGMMVHPASGCYTGTLVNALLHHCSVLSDLNTSLRPGIVHRLDQETSGVMVVAKDNKTHAKLAKQFQEHTIKKRYVALVEGEVQFDEGKIDVPLGRHPYHRAKRGVTYDDSSKEALSYYEVLKRTKTFSYVALYPQTGRTHQLRVHMSYIHHPILGDDKYGKKENFPRLALHAQSIGFVHPKTKHFVEFCVRPPEVMLKKAGII